MNKLTAVITMVLLGVLAACSGIKSYPNQASKNLHVRSKLVEARMFSSIQAALDIYSVDGKCETEYLGTVDLDKAEVDVGLPPGRQLYLVFVFSSKGMLSSNGSTSYATLLRTRAGADYRAEVRYVDDIYNVELSEGAPGRKGGQELAPRRLESCRTS